jgi:uncharacterized MAPEG superfamily protein
LTDIQLLVVAALLTWFSLMLASVLRTRSWTAEGRVLGFGNREVMPEPSAVAGRADRAAWNLVENMPIFLCVVLAARLANAAPENIAVGANVFVWARVAYLLVYLAGIPYVRTLLFGLSVVGMGMVAATAL